MIANAIAVSNGDVFVAGIRGYDSQQAQVPYSGENADYPITGTLSTPSMFPTAMFMWRAAAITASPMPGIGKTGIR
jgi:hypothetical protein